MTQPWPPKRTGVRIYSNGGKTQKDPPYQKLLLHILSTWSLQLHKTDQQEKTAQLCICVERGSLIKEKHSATGRSFTKQCPSTYNKTKMDWQLRPDTPRQFVTFYNIIVICQNCVSQKKFVSQEQCKNKPKNLCLLSSVYLISHHFLKLPLPTRSGLNDVTELILPVIRPGLVFSILRHLCWVSI